MKKKRIFNIIMAASILLAINSSVVYADSFSNLDDVQKNIYEHLQNRDNKFSFVYTGNKDEFKNNISDVIKKAYQEDDYTERSWVEVKPKASISGKEIDTTIDVTYLTTKEQETFVDTELKKIIEEIIKPNMTDIEKIKAISDYITDRYDYDSTLKSNNAYSALVTGKTICQGYSMTAYKMLNLAGIKNRIIVGTLNGNSHSWNYVNIQDKWYHLDITNDDTTRTDRYFLVGDIVLIYNNYAWSKTDYPQ